MKSLHDYRGEERAARKRRDRAVGIEVIPAYKAWIKALIRLQGAELAQPPKQ